MRRVRLVPERLARRSPRLALGLSTVAAAMLAGAGAMLSAASQVVKAEGGPVSGVSDRGVRVLEGIPYVFNVVPSKDPRESGFTHTDIDYRLADAMSSFWVNFVSTGDPNGRELPT
jgi:carboxylesterase type B